MGTRLMIIELRKYIEVRELLIEDGTTGSQAQVIYQDGDQMASVLGQLSAWRRRGHGCKQGTGAHTIGLQVRNENRHPYNCGEIKEALACNKIEIE